MKKLIAATAILFSTIAQAHTFGGHDPWSLVIGGTLGYMFANQQRPVVVQPAPVIVNPPVYNNSPSVYNLPRAAQPIYERRSQYDSSCMCYREIYVQIGWQ